MEPGERATWQELWNCTEEYSHDPSGGLLGKYPDLSLLVSPDLLLAPPFD